MSEQISSLETMLEKANNQILELGGEPVRVSKDDASETEDEVGFSSDQEIDADEGCGEMGDDVANSTESGHFWGSSSGTS